MPSPAKRYTQRSPASSSSTSRRGAGGSPSALESVNVKNTKNNNQGGDTTESESIAVAARRRLLNNSNDNDNNDNNIEPSMTHIQMVGKRTGVTLPPRGEIPLDEDGLEDADAFFAAANSPANAPGTAPPPSNNNNNKKIRERDRRDEERRKRHEALEEEGRKNALKRPDILNNEANDSGSDEDGGEGGGNSNNKFIDKYQPTPKQPNWSNRLLHQAMGIDVTNEDGEQQQQPPEYSPQYTVLSKVSTAAPSTQGSLETIATESRHALRGKLNSVQLDQLAVGKDEEEEQEAEFDGPMDPPEEVSEWADHSLTGENKKGVDPEERDVYLEPETQQDDDDGVNAKQSAKSAASSGAGSSTNVLETSLEEVVDNFDNDHEGMEGGMQFATQEDDFGGGGGGGFDDDDDGFHNDGVDDDDAMNNDVASAAAASQQSRKSNSSSQVSTKSGKTSLLSDEEEEEVPQKKKGKKDKKAPPITPTSVLRTKKTSKKKKQTNNNRHVNWSTPNGVSTGIPLANRDFESIPVTDFKESYPPGEEPKTPGGSRSLRRSRRGELLVKFVYSYLLEHFLLC